MVALKDCCFQGPTIRIRIRTPNQDTSFAGWRCPQSLSNVQTYLKQTLIPVAVAGDCERIMNIKTNICCFTRYLAVNSGLQVPGVDTGINQVFGGMKDLRVSHPELTCLWTIDEGTYGGDYTLLSMMRRWLCGTRRVTVLMNFKGSMEQGAESGARGGEVAVQRGGRRSTEQR